MDGKEVKNTITFQNCLAISSKVKYALNYVERIPFLGNFSIERKACNHKRISVRMPIMIIILRARNWQGTQMSIDR